MFDEIVKAVVIKIKSDDQASGVFGKLGLSTKSLSAGIVTMNQAWQLTSSVMSGIAKVAGTVYKGMKEIADETIDLLKVGGAYNEQRVMFERLATSHGINGESMILTIQKITSNTTDLTSTMRVASKAIATGMAGDDIKTALTYAKKYSEATGETFTSVAEKLVQAMATGRTTTLKSLGIITSKAGEVIPVMEAVKSALEGMGESGYNSADRFTSMNNSLDEFHKRIGQAVQDSPALQQGLSRLDEIVFNFVKNFDYKTVAAIAQVIVQTIDAVVGGVDGLAEKVIRITTAIEIFGEKVNAYKDGVGFLSQIAGTGTDWDKEEEARVVERLVGFKKSVATKVNEKTKADEGVSWWGELKTFGTETVNKAKNLWSDLSQVAKNEGDKALESVKKKNDAITKATISANTKIETALIKSHEKITTSAISANTKIETALIKSHEKITTSAHKMTTKVYTGLIKTSGTMFTTMQKETSKVLTGIYSTYTSNFAAIQKTVDPLNKAIIDNTGPGGDYFKLRKAEELVKQATTEKNKERSFAKSEAADERKYRENATNKFIKILEDIKTALGSNGSSIDGIDALSNLLIKRAGVMAEAEGVGVLSA